MLNFFISLFTKEKSYLGACEKLPWCLSGVLHLRNSKTVADGSVSKALAMKPEFKPPRADRNSKKKLNRALVQNTGFSSQHSYGVHSCL